LPPLVMDPINPAIAYVAGQRVYRTANSGTAWAQLPAFDADTTRVVIALAVAPASRQTIYAVTACLAAVNPSGCGSGVTSTSILWRSTNSGQSWTQMSTIPG